MNFFIFSPAELYTSWLDWKFIGVVFWGNGDLVYLRWLFLQRITALQGIPVIAILCYYTIIALCIWRPFVKVEDSTSTNREGMAV